MIPRPSVPRVTVLIVACACGLAAIAGCSGNSAARSAANAGATAFDKHRQFQVLPVAKFAGRITIDGKPPATAGQTPGEQTRGKLFVILTDPNHLDEHARGTLPKLYTLCDADGHFAFGTYDLKHKNDGVVAGKYVVTFVQLHKFIPKSAKAKAPPKTPGRDGYERYSLPDDLKNLYSDPDRNAKRAEFLVNLQPPGKDDYQFDLRVAGETPPPKPAPHAVTYMVLSK